MIAAAGGVVKLSRKQDGEGFLGAVVGLGALGVVTKNHAEYAPHLHGQAIRVRKSCGF